MKLNKTNSGYINNQAVSVLNTLDLPDNGQAFSADNVPVGMREDATNNLSSNFGTQRDSVKAGALVGNESVYVDFGLLPNVSVQNFEIILYAKDLQPGRSNTIYAQDHIYDTSGWRIGKTANDVVYLELKRTGSTTASIMEITWDGVGAAKITAKVYGSTVYMKVNEVEQENQDYTGVDYTGVTKSLLLKRPNNETQHTIGSIGDVQINELDSSGNYIKTLAHYKTQEGSGNIVYDSSGNGNHGDIINPYEGMWGEHNGYSYADEEGFSDSIDIINSNSTIAIGDIKSGDVLEFLINTTDSKGAILSKDDNNTAYFSFIADSGIDYGFSGSFGAFDVYVDDILYDWEIASNSRVEFHTLIADGVTHKLKYILRSGQPDQLNVNIAGSTVPSGNTLTARISSISLNGVIIGIGAKIPAKTPTTDIFDNPLTYIGKCPSKAEYVESPCYLGNGSSSLSEVTLPRVMNGDFEVSAWITCYSGTSSENLFNADASGNRQWQFKRNATKFRFLLLNAASANDFLDTITDIDDSTPKHIRVTYNSTTQLVSIYVNGILDTSKIFSVSYDHVLPTEVTFSNFDGIVASNTSQVFGAKILDSIGEVFQMPLTEPIKNFANHTYHDVVGGNHASLVNGSLANEGVQDVFHYGELGYGLIFDTYKDFGYLEALNTNDFSISGGFYLEDNSNIQTILSVNFNNTNKGYTLRYDTDGYLRFRYAPIGEIHQLVQLEQINLNEIYSFELIKSGFDLTLILNEVSYSYTLVYDTIDTSSDNTIIGGRIASGVVGLEIGENSYVQTTYINGIEFKGESVVPALFTDLTKDALGNPLTVTQDGKSFLGTCKIKHVEMGRVIEADPIYTKRVLGKDLLTFANDVDVSGNFTQDGDSIFVNTGLSQTVQFLNPEFRLDPNITADRVRFRVKVRNSVGWWIRIAASPVDNTTSTSAISGTTNIVSGGIYEVDQTSENSTPDYLTVLQCSFAADTIIDWVEVEYVDSRTFWFTPTGVANTKELADFTGVIGDQLLSDGGSNMRTHKEALIGRQLNTDKVLTNNN